MDEQQVSGPHLTHREGVDRLGTARGPDLGHVRAGFEHPGLLTIEQDGPLCDAVPGCITCSDEGRVAEVLEASADMAEVRTAGGSETIDTLAVGEVRAGDLLLVHAGTAIAVLERTGAGA